MIRTFPDTRFDVQVKRSAEPVSFAFEPALFNLPDYVYLNPVNGLVSFYLIRRSSGKAEALFHAYLNNSAAISPARAPFGSFETTTGLPLKITEDFIKTVMLFLKEAGAAAITIRHYPFVYGPLPSAIITNALLFLGFTVSLSQINHHLPVGRHAFECSLHESAKRRLQKCHKNGFVFRRENPEFLPQAYKFIKACRLAKNKPLSLTEPQLQQLFDHFPDRYFIFSVYHGQEIAALTVAVLVQRNVLLTFYPASPESFNAFSPTIFLNEGLYNFCRMNSIETLDYGISGVKEDPHYSLMKFKEHIGGKPGLKLTFSGNL